MKKKSVFFLHGIVYLKKGLMFVLKLFIKTKNTMKTLSNILAATFFTALFIYTLFVLIGGLFLNLGFNLPFNDMTFGIFGACIILAFSKLYTNFNI